MENPSWECAHTVRQDPLIRAGPYVPTRPRQRSLTLQTNAESWYGVHFTPLRCPLSPLTTPCPGCQWFALQAFRSTTIMWAANLEPLPSDQVSKIIDLIPIISVQYMQAHPMANTCIHPRSALFLVVTGMVLIVSSAGFFQNEHAAIKPPTAD